MKKVVASFKCKECGDVFEATSEEYVKCKCEKCWVKPDQYSTGYKTSDGAGLNFERINTKVYYDKNDYLRLSRKTQLIWNIVRRYKLTNKQFYTYEWYDNSADGNKYLREINLEIISFDDVEMNTIKLNIRLTKTTTNEYVFEKLKYVYDMLKKINKKEINLNDRKQLKNISENYSKKQCDYYDYDFYL